MIFLLFIIQLHLIIVSILATDTCVVVRKSLFSIHELEKSFVAHREWRRLLPIYMKSAPHIGGHDQFNIFGPIGPKCTVDTGETKGLVELGDNPSSKFQPSFSCGLELVTKENGCNILHIGTVDNHWAFERSVFRKYTLFSLFITIIVFFCYVTFMCYSNIFIQLHLHLHLHLSTVENTLCKIDTFDCTAAADVSVPTDIDSRVTFHRTCLGKTDEVLENGHHFLMWTSIIKLIGGIASETPIRYVKLDITGNFHSMDSKHYYCYCYCYCCCSITCIYCILIF